MLPKENRLTDKNEFTRVLKRGVIVQTSLFGLAYLKEGNNPSRFGFIVSNKISKRAHIRNKIKRRLREITRNVLGQIKEGFSFVVLAKSSLIEASYNDIDVQFKNGMRKIGAMNEIGKVESR